MVIHQGCKISLIRHGSVNGYVWEDTLYVAESDDVFPTIDEAKANIDLYFGHGPTPRVIYGEIHA